MSASSNTASPSSNRPSSPGDLRKRVLIESPCAGDWPLNLAYARRAMAHSIGLGEAPFASHLLYAQPGILDDNKPAERRQGIEAGLLWGQAADLTAVYMDLGISPGMREGIRRAEAEGRPVEYRTIGDICWRYDAVRGKASR